MKNNMFKSPSYYYYDYLLVLAPHEDLCRKILSVKNEFGKKYKAQSNAGGKPYVMLVKFVQREMMEEKLLNRLKNIAMGFYPFKVELKDYGAFPTHSIFIHVSTKVEIQNLVKQLHQTQQLIKSPEVKPHFITEPFIPLVQKLVPWQFEQGWLEMSHRHFTGRFIADSMLLLKRKQGSRGYQIVQRLEFLNLPITTKQGNLFMS